MSSLVFLRQPAYGLSLKEFGFLEVKPTQPRKFRELNPDIIWRWGYSGNQQLDNQNPQFKTFIVNRAEAMFKISNKYGFLKLCKENNIRVPEFCLSNSEQVFKWYETENYTGKVLGRKFNHFGGKDIKVFDNLDDLYDWDSNVDSVEQPDFFTKFIPKTNEYRVYTFFGRVLAVQEKIVEDKSQIAWNHSQGSSFKNVRWGNWPIKALELCLKAQKVTGIDFCAWDVILGEDNKFYLLEGNTAPSITGEYKLNIIKSCVLYLEEYLDTFGGLPEHFVFPEEMCPINERCDWHYYIHPLMLDNVDEE